MPQILAQTKHLEDKKGKFQNKTENSQEAILSC